MNEKTPSNMGPKSKAFWTAITSEYELRADELRILEDACREIDLIEKMEKEMRTQPLTVQGSMGQIVAHPLTQELRQHRAIFKTLIAALKFEDGDSDAGSRSASAAELARARWGGRGA